MAFPRISHDPAVMGGKPCLRGLRITVGTIVGLIASGNDRERILQAYPLLENLRTLMRPWPMPPGGWKSGKRRWS